jgi:hypothetical protein
MPEVRRRVMGFQEEHGVDVSPEEMGRALTHHFVVKDQRLVAIAAVDGPTVHGHVLFSLEELPEGMTTKILQYQTEGVPEELIDDGFDMIIDWAKEKYAKKVLVEVRDEARARLFRKFGFKHRGILLERGL